LNGVFLKIDSDFTPGIVQDKIKGAIKALEKKDGEIRTKKVLCYFTKTGQKVSWDISDLK
jgi:hypothetical protein